MSINLMADVFNADLQDIEFEYNGRPLKVTAPVLTSTLLAMADSANEDGKGSYNGIARLTKKTKLAERSVVNAIQAAKSVSLLTYDGVSVRGTSEYTLNVDMLRKMAFKDSKKASASGAETSPASAPGAERPLHQVQNPSAPGADDPSFIHPSSVQGAVPARPSRKKGDILDGMQHYAEEEAKREAETGVKAELMDRFNAYPPECRFTLMWLQDCYQWPASLIPVRSKNKKRNAEFAYWVESLRSINALLVGVTDKNQVLSAAAKKLEDVTVSSPASMVKTVGWAVGQYSKRQATQTQRNQKQAEPTPYERALLRRQQRQSQNVPTA